jgi:23S rRNA pseudouridine2605 synthase
VQKNTGNRPSKAAGNKSDRKPGPVSPDEPLRLQRVLASAGFGSRRQCEELIEEGRVDVNGEVVTKLGTTVTPANDKIRVDGVTLKSQRLVYFAVNKPVGFVTTNRDPQGRPRVVDLVPPNERVFPVGRLDLSSEGLILLTNDGELAQRLTHPKFGIRKIYRVTVAGKVDHEAMKKMRNGIYIAEGLVKVEGVRLIKAKARATDLEIVLSEGKNREIRRILARLGHKVMTLQRIAVGPVRLGDVPPGSYRILGREDVEKLYRAVENTLAEAAQSRLESTEKRPRERRASTGISRRPGGKEASVKRRLAGGAKSSDRSEDAPRRASEQTQTKTRVLTDRPTTERENTARPAREARARPAREGAARPARTSAAKPARTGSAKPAISRTSKRPLKVGNIKIKLPSDRPTDVGSVIGGDVRVRETEKVGGRISKRKAATRTPSANRRPSSKRGKPKKSDRN